jgi:hypothetical protein
MGERIEIKLSGAFGVKQGRLERLIRLLGPLLELEHEAEVEVDLSGLVSVSPAALALLTATLKRPSLTARCHVRRARSPTVPHTHTTRHGRRIARPVRAYTVGRGGRAELGLKAAATIVSVCQLRLASDL